MGSVAAPGSFFDVVSDGPWHLFSGQMESRITLTVLQRVAGRAPWVSHDVVVDAVDVGYADQRVGVAAHQVGR